MAQLDRASGFGPEGWGFESLWVQNYLQNKHHKARVKYIIVKIYPKSSATKVEKVDQPFLINPFAHIKVEGVYKVYVKSPPVNNKANIELLKVLKKHFKKQVTIVKGNKARIKLLGLE